MTCGIYGIFSEDYTRVYVGQAQDIEKRWAVHDYYISKGEHHCKYLKNYINKYGVTLDFQILQECEIKDLNELETGYWDYYKSQGLKMFNQRPDGGVLRGSANGMYGRKISESHRLAISNHSKNRKISEETRQKLKDRVFSKTHKLNLSLAGKNRVFTQKHRENISLSKRGDKSASAIYAYWLAKGNSIHNTNCLATFFLENGLGSSTSMVATFNRKPKYFSSKGFYPVARTNIKTQVTELYDSYFSLTPDQLAQLTQD